MVDEVAARRSAATKRGKEADLRHIKVPDGHGAIGLKLRESVRIIRLVLSDRSLSRAEFGRVPIAGDGELRVLGDVIVLKVVVEGDAFLLLAVWLLIKVKEPHRDAFHSVGQPRRRVDELEREVELVWRVSVISRWRRVDGPQLPSNSVEGEVV